jgi:DNA-binding MarR family transcriptional regulator
MRAYGEVCVETFREAIGNVDCPLQAYHLFLYLPESGTVSLAQVRKLFGGLSHASVSRNIALLGSTSILRAGGGFGLVSLEEDHQDRRNKLVALNLQGKNLRKLMHDKGLLMYRRILGEDQHHGTD